MSSKIVHICKNCGRRAVVAPAMAGLEAVCRVCGTEFVVPAAPAPSPSPAPPDRDDDFIGTLESAEPIAPPRAKRLTPTPTPNSGPAAWARRSRAALIAAVERVRATPEVGIAATVVAVIMLVAPIFLPRPKPRAEIPRVPAAVVIDSGPYVAPIEKLFGLLGQASQEVAGLRPPGPTAVQEGSLSRIQAEIDASADALANMPPISEQVAAAVKRTYGPRFRAKLWEAEFQIQRAERTGQIPLAAIPRIPPVVKRLAEFLEGGGESPFGVRVPNAPVAPIVVRVSGLVDAQHEAVVRAQIRALADSLERGAGLRVREREGAGFRTFELPTIRSAADVAGRIRFGRVSRWDGGSIEVVADAPPPRPDPVPVPVPDRRLPPKQQALADLKSNEPEKRRYALRTLESMTTEAKDARELVDAALPLRNDPDPSVRISAARIVGPRAEASDVATLLEWHEADTNDQVRRHLLDAFVRIPDARAAKILVDAFINYRREAQAALQAIGSGAEEEVWRMLVHDAPHIRRAGFEILAAIGTDASLKRLLPIARREDPDSEQARQAVSAIRSRLKD